MRKTLTFKAEDRPMKDVLFSNDARFRIPRYQRPYAWSEDDVEEFWNDLLQDDALFIGSMIFNYEHVESEGYIDVIDGQQRLLSITILEAVLRDIARNYDPKLSELINEFEIALKDREGAMDFRIRCGDTTRPFFENYIQNSDTNVVDAKTRSAEELRIKRNYIFFHDRVSNEVGRFNTHEDKIGVIKGIRKKLETMIVIHVRIDSEEEAYEIFETTNARGVDLSVADLVKNLILKKLRSEGSRDDAKVKWEEMRENVQDSGTELKRFIRYYWVSKHKACPEKRLFREIKNQTTDWQGLLDDLHRDAEVFNDLYECNETDCLAKGIHPEIYRSLVAIRNMNFTISYLFLVRLFSNYSALGMNPRRIVKAVENFTFLYSAVCRLPINKCEKVYSRYAVELHKAVQSQESKRRVAVERVFGNLENELNSLLPTFEVFKESFMAIAYKKNSEQARKLIRYVLDSVNTHMTTTKEVRVDPYNVNIEHILPQTPDKRWGLSKQEIASYVNLLGNLTLVDKRINSQAGNVGLKMKLDVLEKSQLPITAEVVDQIRTSSQIWGESQILQRQEKLAKLAYYNVWRTSMPDH
jgi:uncharacterized protein with ParB-like and HNH nuclease domain